MENKSKNLETRDFGIFEIQIFIRAREGFVDAMRVLAIHIADFAG